MTQPRLLTRPFLLSSLANLFQGMAFSLYLHFPGFLEDLGAAEAEIGLISGATALAAILVRPTVGRLMDRRGRRPALLLGNVLNTAVVGLYLTVDTIGPWVYMVRILHGIAEGILFTSLFTFAADWIPESRRTEGLSIFGVSGMLSISLGGLLGDGLLAIDGYALLFSASLGLAGLALLCSLPLYDAPRVQTPTHEQRIRFRSTLMQRDLIPVWAITGCFSIALTGVFVFVKTFVQSSGVGSVGGFFTAYSAAAITLRLLFGWLPDRIGPRRLLVPSLAALALGFLALSHAHSMTDMLLAGLLAGTGHGYLFPVLLSLTISRTPDAQRGAAMAIFTALFDFGVLLGGPLLGWVIERAGYPTMYQVAALILGIGGVLFFVGDRRRSINA